MISINTRALRFCFLSTIVAAAAAASAVPITYVVSGNASGILDGMSFTNQNFTITGIADTSGITGTNVFAVSDTFVGVQVDTAGSDTITDSIVTVSNHFALEAGFGDASEGLFLAGDTNAAFATYDLSTSIGPLTGPFVGNPGATFGTTNGTFELDTVNSASFQATINAVPEPCSMLGLGLGVIALLRRRNRR